MACSASVTTVKTNELPQNRLRRMKYWEKVGPGGKPSRPDITALDGVRFILHRIYSDGSLNLDSTLGESACSMEELVGILLTIRDELITHDTYEAINDDSSECDIPMRNRMAELIREGYSKDEVKEVIRMEYPQWLRVEIFCRMNESKAGKK